MNQKNNYYPLTRVWEEYNVVFTREYTDKKRYEILKWELIPIVVECNLNDDVKSVSKTTAASEEDNKLYLSLKRHKGKIAWDRHFSI